MKKIIAIILLAATVGFTACEKKKCSVKNTELSEKHKDKRHKYKCCDKCKIEKCCCKDFKEECCDLCEK